MYPCDIHSFFFTVEDIGQDVYLAMYTTTKILTGLEIIRGMEVASKSQFKKKFKKRWLLSSVWHFGHLQSSHFGTKTLDTNQSILYYHSFKI